MPSTPLTEADLKSALPDMSTTRVVEDAGDPIEIFRDAQGIPHVRARSYHDAFFGQAFAASQDRLWHMEHDRRLAYGSWAEVVGESGVEQDVLMRRMRIRASVEADYEALNLAAKSMLDAYASGVNAFINGPDPLPVEYVMVETAPEPWQPWDCLAVFKARHILMGVYEGKLWRARLINELGVRAAAEILPAYPQGNLQITPPGTEYSGDDWAALVQLSAGAEYASWLKNVESGSNSWLLSGSRTASGKPLLAGDPHRGLDTPNVYYQNHVACPEFDAIGLSFPGCPGFPHFGHNEHVAWCVTHAQADYQDVYLEKFEAGSPSTYEFQGESLEVGQKHEVIAVRGSSPVEIETTWTHHGPIIAGNPASGYGIALKYTALDGPNKWSECLPRMLRARSVDDMDEAMRSWVDPSNNFMFADTQGDIEYLNRGRLPVRPELNAWLPVPGWSGDYEWNGSVPFDELVRSRNPSAGYIVTANNRIAGDDYPHYIALHYSPDYRARRIKDRLEVLDGATVDDMAAVHTEAVSIPAQVYTALLVRVTPGDKASALALEKLKGWDGSMAANEIAPTVYSAFRLSLERALINHNLQDLANDALSASGRGAPMHVAQLRARFTAAAQNGDTSVLPPNTDWNLALTMALTEGVAFLQQEYGEDMDSWEWGKVHTTNPKHTLSVAFPESALLLDPPVVPMSGDGDTPHSAGYDASEPFDVTGTSVARYVFDLKDWSRSRWITPLGSSGHPGSPHYTDQVTAWGQRDLVPMLYDWDRIEAEAESRQQLCTEG